MSRTVTLTLNDEVERALAVLRAHHETHLAQQGLPATSMPSEELMICSAIIGQCAAILSLDADDDGEVTIH